MREDEEVVPPLEIAGFVVQNALAAHLRQMVQRQRDFPISFALQTYAYCRSDMVYDLGELQIGGVDGLMVGEARLYFRKVFRPHRLLYSCNVLTTRETALHHFSGFRLLGKVIFEDEIRLEPQSYSGNYHHWEWPKYHW